MNIEVVFGDTMIQDSIERMDKTGLEIQKQFLL